MPKFGQFVIGAIAALQMSMGLVVATTAPAQAQAAPQPVLPHLSYAKAQYYHEHPAEFAELKSRLTVPHNAVGPIVNPPQAEPIAGGTWTAVAAPLPSGGAGAPKLMMDGTVLVNSYCTGNWYKLKPDIHGKYASGTWTRVASMPNGYAPLYFASQVLPGGKLIVQGGEYQNCSDTWTTQGAIYDPVANKWSNVAPPSGWSTIGDAQSVVLKNKTYMVANCCTPEMALLNITNMTWTATGTNKFDRNDEEGWSLLPSGKVFTADAYTGGGCGTGTELYDPTTGAWASAGNSPVQLSDCTISYEVGPQVLRSNGTVVLFSGVTTGAVAGTAVYHTTTSSFTTGAHLPKIGGEQYTLADAPAALLPNGRILFAAGPTPAFNNPTHFFEYYPNNTIVQNTNDTPNAPGEGSYVINLLVLPSGQVMQTDFSNTVQLYNPTGSPLAGTAPNITSVATSITRGTVYTAKGVQLHGLSEAGAYGDDYQAATDYPIFRLTNNATGHVFYCTTTGESSRDIAPNASTTANFKCPTAAETGASKLVAVTNGVPSNAIAVTVN